MPTQRPPQPDNRYRVHRSVKCYLAELTCGTQECTWYLHDSIQRVVYLFPGGVEKVQYKRRFYELQSPERLKELVSDQLRRGGAIHLGGKCLAPNEADQGFQSFPYIDVSSMADKERYERLPSGNGAK